MLIPNYISEDKATIRFFNCDNMEFMQSIPDKFYPLAITDPPYGVNRDEGFVGFVGFGGFGAPIKRKKYKKWGDEETPDKKYFDELLRISENVMIFGGQFFTDKLPVSGHWIFWDKLNTMPTFGDGELIYTNFNRNSVKRIVIEYNGLLGKEKEARIHATQKPIKLYRWLLQNYAKAGQKIFDSHFGSGSIAIACDMEGYSLDCTEIDRDYFDAAIKRFKIYKSQKTLF